MCETCLLSFATEKATDCYTYKSLVGILHKDIEMFVDNDQDHHFTLPTARKDDSMHAERIIRNPCSCCGEPLKAKSYFKGKGSSMVSQAPTPSPRAPFGNLKNEDHRNMELPNMRFTELKFSDNESEPHEDDDGQNTSHVAREDVKAATVPSLPEAEYMNEDRTPTFARGNRFFGIPLTDSATCSPRWTNRIPRKSPLEKTELASESTEGSTVQNEGDGDLTLHHMKGQARLDRKSLMALYMELDEERNASAIAANNAMAMITRLQAEKASVQMEALQYQRMMEEQAEYDQEALQATNNLLRKRDEDINALEAELDEYRERYGLLREESFEGSGDEFDEGYLEKNAQSISSENISPDYSFIDGCINEENLHSNNQSSSMWDVNGEGTPNMLDKGGRSYLGRLKSLEKRIHLLSDDGAPFLQAISNNITHDEDTAQERTLMNELLQLHERVRALEDEEVSKHAAGDTTQSDTEREKLLTDICDNIQQLRQFISMPLSEGQDA